MGTLSLGAADRRFFTLVSQAAFANPFSEKRENVDREISGIQGAHSYQAALQGAVDRVYRRIEELRASDRADIRAYNTEDGVLLKYAILFDLYHRSRDDFDQLIVLQKEAGDTPCRVGFAQDAIGFLRSCGFPGRVAIRYFAMFYQLRRAHYFISRTLVGQGPAMLQLRTRLWNNVFTHNGRWYDEFLWDRMEDFSTLLLGETGSGKGAAASAIGCSGMIPFDDRRGCFSESFTGTFIAINLSQYPESLIESELFGHEKGAFTGAIEAHEGVFARTSPYGTIFLDEIGDVRIPVQIKLLGVLQERTFQAVGSHETRTFRGRVIAATNQSIEALRHQGKFRDDFFYRLCSDVIVVPPLRQRLREDPGELEILVQHAVRKITGRESPPLVSMVLNVIRRTMPKDYAWPGNVRELEQCVRRVILTDAYAPDGYRRARDAHQAIMRRMEDGALDAGALTAFYCRMLYRRLGTYEEVARRVGLDRRTVRKYVLADQDAGGDGESA